MRANRTLPRGAHPYSALVRVAEGGPPAGGPLIQWLWSRRWGRVQSELRDDVLQSVGSTLLCDAPRILATLRQRHPGLDTSPTANQRVECYVSVMVRNRGQDLIRQARPAPQVMLGNQMEPHGEGLLDLKATVEVLERGWQQASQVRPSSARGLEELRQLTFEPTAMDELVDRLVSPNADSASRDRARERIYMQHRRARAVLKDVLHDMASTGEVSRLHAEQATAWVDQLLVRRRSQGRASTR